MKTGLPEKRRAAGRTAFASKVVHRAAAEIERGKTWTIAAEHARIADTFQMQMQIEAGLGMDDYDNRTVAKQKC